MKTNNNNNRTMNRFRLLRLTIKEEMRESIFFVLIDIINKKTKTMMLLTILSRMSNDEQRLQLLQTLRNRLANYNLNWTDILNIIDLFENKDSKRFDLIQFFIVNIKNLTENNNINMDDFICLLNQCTNNNEYFKICLFEQLYQKLKIEDQDELQCLKSLFQTRSNKRKIETILRKNSSNFIREKQKEKVNDQLIIYPEPTTTDDILSPTLSIAPLKRKYSFDHAYQDETCQQILTPSLIVQQDEFIQQRNILSSISISSSNSSLSSTSDDIIPIRTQSFMLAIKKTFQRLKETSI